MTLLSPLVTWQLGYAYALSSRGADGCALLQQALTSIQSAGMGAFLPAVNVHLGEACLLADRLDDALEIAGRALGLACERGQRGYEAYARRLLGEIASRRDPPDIEAAEGHSLQALALAEELGMRPLVAHCHFGLGTLYQRTGKRQHAQEHITTATTMFREMDMGFWLEKAEAELRG